MPRQKGVPDRSWPEKTAATRAALSRATPLELAWLAGLLDGEGCISFTGVGTGGTRRQPYVCIAMTHEPTIRRVHELWGSSRGIYIRDPAPYQLQYTTSIGGPGPVSEVLQRLQPFLVTKALEAHAMLECCTTMTAEHLCYAPPSFVSQLSALKGPRRKGQRLPGFRSR